MTHLRCSQVGVAVLDTGEKLQCDLCLVGVGARPNLGLFQGDLDMLDDKPGGVKASAFPSQLKCNDPVEGKRGPGRGGAAGLHNPELHRPCSLTPVQTLPALPSKRPTSCKHPFFCEKEFEYNSKKARAAGYMMAIGAEFVQPQLIWSHHFKLQLQPGW